MLLFGIRLECKHFWLNILLRERDCPEGGVKGFSTWLRDLLSPMPHEYRVTPYTQRAFNCNFSMAFQKILRLSSVFVNFGLSPLVTHHCTRLKLFPELIITQTKSLIHGIKIIQSNGGSNREIHFYNIRVCCKIALHPGRQSIFVSTILIIVLICSWEK